MEFDPSNISILIADDELHGRELLGALLEPHGYQLLFAEDGVKALAQARRHVPDLVLLDVMMPGKDGFEVCQELRSDSELAEVPIMLLTALEDRDSRLRGIESGADDFITKPYDRRELAARVRMVCRLNRFRLLVAEREKLAGVIDHAPDGIVIVDETLTVRMANPSAREMFRISGDITLEGLSFNELLTGESASRCENELRDLTPNGSEVVAVESDSMRSNGEEFPLEILARRFAWNGLNALQLNLRDVSEKRRLEDNLLRAQRLQGLGSLAGGIAHDLNNILTPVLVGAGALKGLQTSPDAVNLVENMEQAAHRGSGLVRQILTFARGSEGQSEYVTLKFILGEVCRLIEKALPTSITLRTELAANTPQVYGDPTQIHQLLMNLCVNARDAMPEGGSLNIAIESVSLDSSSIQDIPAGRVGNWVRVSVSDTGTGMPPEVLKRLGEPFFTTKPEGRGTGLGFATVRTILERHQGFMKIESEPGVGSCFHLFLPPALDDETGAEPIAEQLPAGQGELILVADNEAAMREIAQSTLSCYNYRVISVGDGAEAVAEFCRHPDEVSLALCDWRLPFLEGPAVIRALRKLNPDLPCCLTTADERSPDDYQVCEDLAAPLLIKPFTTAQLLQLLDQKLHS